MAGLFLSVLLDRNLEQANGLAFRPLGGLMKLLGAHPQGWAYLVTTSSRWIPFNPPS